jgi:hypothetical protein
MGTSFDAALGHYLRFGTAKVALAQVDLDKKARTLELSDPEVERLRAELRAKLPDGVVVPYGRGRAESPSARADAAMPQLRLSKSQSPYERLLREYGETVDHLADVMRSHPGERVYVNPPGGNASTLAALCLAAEVRVEGRYSVVSARKHGDPPVTMLFQDKGLREENSDDHNARIIEHLTQTTVPLAEEAVAKISHACMQLSSQPGPKTVVLFAEKRTEEEARRAKFPVTNVAAMIEGLEGVKVVIVSFDPSINAEKMSRYGGNAQSLQEGVMAFGYCLSKASSADRLGRSRSMD